MFIRLATGLDLTVQASMLLSKAGESKQVKQEVDSTVILTHIKYVSILHMGNKMGSDRIPSVLGHLT